MSENKKLATVDELFGTPLKRRYAEFALPISGHQVRIRSWSEQEMSHYLALISPVPGSGGRRQQRTEESMRRMIVECLVDAEGNLLLQPKDMEKLKQWDAADTAFLFEKCSDHTGVNTQDVESLAKNSEPTRAASSPST